MKKLTEKEEEIMQALWELKKAFVKDIKEKIPSELHYNTVSTVVRHLQELGYIGHEAFGRTHRYYPLISKEKYSAYYFNSASQRFFNNSYQNMVSFFAKEEKINADELREILAMIEKGEK